MTTTYYPPAVRPTMFLEQDSDDGFFDREPAGPCYRLICPVCGYDYNHAGAPEVIPGNDNYDSRLGPRGDVIRIPVECENHHKWEILIGQHKGNEFLRAGLRP